MSNEDVASVRAEIKAWERAFQEKHGRSATVDDIKENPQIAIKYRCYKKLTKASTSKKSTTPQPSSVLPKSQALEPTSALSSYNPFSPQKNKGKAKALPKTSATLPTPTNPFATPSKSKPKPQIRGPSPSPIQESQPTLALPVSESLPPLPPTAVRRARKRLRGEPVSPSPHKDKKRRVQSVSSESGQSDEEEAGHSSFVADSPVKGPPNFKSLFEDSSGPEKVKAALTRAKSNSVPAGLFGPIRGQSVPVEDDLDSILGPVEGRPLPRLKVTANGLSLSSNLKDNLTSIRDTVSEPTDIQSSGESSDKRKRDLQDSDDESSEPSTSLIPPSPPSDPSSQRPVNIPGKGKGKAPSRKKVRLEDTDDDDMDSFSDDIKVVSVKDHPDAVKNLAVDPDDEINSIFWYNSRGGEVHAGRDDGGERVGGTFEVDLPDKLKHVLALSSSDSKLRDTQEGHVVQNLMYGRRTTNYEPSKGGEIWDVGDVEESDGYQQDGGDGRNRSVAEDEEWEAEPVPWEVGEL